MKFIKYVIILFTFCLVMACSSDDEVGNLNITFNNVVGDEDLVLQQNTYNKNGGENFSVDELKYIISNIVLIDSNGNEFIYPEEDSYFLINEKVAQSHSISLLKVNAKNYSSIRFGIGVDQSSYPLNGLVNFVPTAEENDMMWSWSAGYIFMKIEGLYSSSQTTDGNFRYHIGSHGTNLDNYKEVSLDFEQPIAVNDAQSTNVNINFDVLKMFSADHDMLFEVKDDIQIDPENAPKISENYSKAFEIGLN